MENYGLLSLNAVPDMMSDPSASACASSRASKIVRIDEAIPDAFPFKLRQPAEGDDDTVVGPAGHRPSHSGIASSVSICRLSSTTSLLANFHSPASRTTRST